MESRLRRNRNTTDVLGGWNTPSSPKFWTTSVPRPFGCKWGRGRFSPAAGRRCRNVEPPVGLWTLRSSSKFWTTYLVLDPSRRRRLQPPPMSFVEIAVVAVDRAAPRSQISPGMIFDPLRDGAKVPLFANRGFGFFGF